MQRSHALWLRQRRTVANGRYHGAADANTAARAAVHVQTILRRDYDLLTD